MERDTSSVYAVQALQNARGETASGSREREGGLSKAASQENLKDGAEEARTKDEKDRGGLPGIDCSVCLNRPVQVPPTPALFQRHRFIL